MPDQLSLFPSDFADRPEKSSDSTLNDRSVDLSPVDEVFEIGRSRRSLQDYLELLDFISRFPRYSPLNTFLLYTQNPSATLVATAATWGKVFNRRPAMGARPLIILAPMSPVVFVYDVAETEGDPIQGKNSKAVFQSGRWSNKVYEHTIANGVLHGIETREIPPNDRRSASVMPLTGGIRETYRSLDISPMASYLILVDNTMRIENRYAALVHDLGRIFCGHLGIDDRAWWSDRREFSTASEAIEVESVTYLVCGRKGLKEAVKTGVPACEASNRELPRFSWNTILQVVGYIEEMGKSAWKYPKKKSRYK